jgi:hypothetical protein
LHAQGSALTKPVHLIKKKFSPKIFAKSPSNEVTGGVAAGKNNFEPRP